MSLTKLLNDLIGGYITANAKPEKKKTGRGNIDLTQLELAKEFLRLKHPDGARASEVAGYVREKSGGECSRARAERLLDYLSGHCTDNANSVTGFLIYEDDFAKPPLFYIAKDVEASGNAGKSGL